MAPAIKGALLRLHYYYFVCLKDELKCNMLDSFFSQYYAILARLWKNQTCETLLSRTEIILLIYAND